MTKFFNEQVRNFDWSLFQSSKPDSAPDSVTSTNTDSTNPNTSKKDPFSFTLFFSPIRNERRTEENTYEHPFPVDHPIKQVKNWLLSKKIFDNKDIETFRKTGKHSFIILSYFKPALPYAPHNAEKLGWAQLFPSPSYNTSNFLISFPNQYSSKEMKKFAIQMGTISSWRRFTGSLNKPLSNMGCFYFSSVTPLLLSYLYTPKSQRRKCDIVITPTENTRGYSCKKCLLNYHSAKCPFPDADGVVPLEFTKYFTRTGSNTTTTAASPEEVKQSMQRGICTLFENIRIEEQQVKSLSLQSDAYEARLYIVQEALSVSNSKNQDLLNKIKALESTVASLTKHIEHSKPYLQKRKDELVNKNELIVNLSLTINRQDLEIQLLETDLSKSESRYDNHLVKFQAEADDFKRKYKSDIAELKSVIKQKDVEIADLVDKNDDSVSTIKRELLQLRQKNFMSFSHNSNLEKEVSRKDVTITNLNSKIQSLERENLNFKFLAREDSNHSLNKLEHHIQHPSTSNEGSSSSSFNSSNNFNSNHGRSFTRSHIFDTNTSGTNLNTTNLNIGSISTDSSSDALYFNARQKLSEKLKHVSQTPASKSNSLVVTNASLTNPVTKRKNPTKTFHSPNTSPTKAHHHNSTSIKSSSSYGSRPPDPIQF